jgi:hypothetical protein
MTTYREAFANERLRPVTLSAAAIRELKLLDEELKPDRAAAILRAKELEDYCAGTVQAFIKYARTQNSSAGDWEIHGWCGELDVLCKVPAEIQNAVETSNAVEWADIAAPSFTDLVDPYRRSALLREFKRRFAPGDITGACQRIMGQIRDRLNTLAANGAGRQSTITSPPLKDSGGDKIVIIRNLEREEL